MKDKSTYKPPGHLRAETAKWFTKLCDEYVFEDHHVRLLTLIAETWDRGQTAREIIERDGMTFVDRFGTPRPRPEVKIEKDCSIAFARLLREMNLDIERPSETRPPRRTGRH